MEISELPTIKDAFRYTKKEDVLEAIVEYLNDHMEDVNYIIRKKDQLEDMKNEGDSTEEFFKITEDKYCDPIITFFANDWEN